MIRLKSIIIEGFKTEDRVIEINFSSNNVSVLYGMNGCGKTTLLRIINAILDKQESILLNENINKIILLYSVDDIIKKVIINKTEYIVKDETSKDNLLSVKIGYDWSQLQNSELLGVSSILFGVNRGITSTYNISEENIFNIISSTRFVNNFIRREELSAFSNLLSRHINLSQRRRRPYTIKNSDTFSSRVLSLDNVDMAVIEEILIKRFKLAKFVSTERVQKALFDTLADAFNSVNNDNVDLEKLSTMLIANKEKLLEVLRQIEENTLRDKIILILSESDIRKILDECNKNILLTKLIYNMSLELEKEETLLQSIKILKDVFNDHIGPDKYLEIDENKIEVIFKNSSSIHSIYNLSSGERQLLILLTIFIVEGNDKDFLMIDEPELSLNIKWQRRLLPLLSELAPKAQIIVASHSPSIAKENINYLVEMR